MATATPDYEGNYYSDSDKDEPEHETTTEHVKQKQDEITSSADKGDLPPTVNNVTEPPSIPEGEVASKAVRQSLHQRLQSTASEAPSLTDLLDGYGYDSQPETPHSGNAPDDALDEESATPGHEENAVISTAPPVEGDKVPRDSPTPVTTEPVEAAPQPSTELPRLASPPPSTLREEPLPMEESGSFLSDIMEALDSKTEAKLGPTPAVPPVSASAVSTPRSPTAPSPDPSNYWAQMRANLKKRAGSVTQDMARTASHKTDDSTARSSTDSSRSAKPNFPATSDGRSGSFTSYTPVPKFPESRPRRPSSPGLGLPGIPYGRPARPTIDTSGRTMSLTDAPRRGSGSNMQRPVFDGRSSNPGSPVTANAPFSPNGGGGSRSPSGNGNRGDDVGIANIPVFASRDPALRGRSTERGPRPQSPALGTSPTPPSQGMRVTSPTPRSPNPVRVMSPTPPPARSQSPARGARGVSPARNVIPLGGPDGKSRTPSPLKEEPVEPLKESLIPLNSTRSPTPSPLHDIPEERETQEKEVSAPRTPSPVKPAPIPKYSPVAVHLPSMPSRAAPVPNVTPAPQPAPVEQKAPFYPLAPKPQTNSTPSSITPIAILAPEPEIDRNESPSPDPEWREEEEDEQCLSLDKRTTVFLQAASRKKDSLPPLPTELPPMPSLQRPVQVPQNVTSPLIPPPSAPVLESRLPASASNSSLETAPKQTVNPEPRKSPEPTASPHVPVTYPAPASPPVPVTYPSLKNEKAYSSPRAAPSTPKQSPYQPPASPPAPNHPPAVVPGQQPPRKGHKKNASSAFSAFSWRSQRSQPSSSRASAERPRTPMTNPASPTASPVEEYVAPSPVIRLPEIDVSRPITWGPLAFAASSSPGKGDDVPPVPQIPQRMIQNDWEKIEVPEIPKDYLSLNFEDPPEVKLDNSLNLSTVRAVENTPEPESSSAPPVQAKEVEARAPHSMDSDEDIPSRTLDKGKAPLAEEDEQIPNTEAISDAESMFGRSKYVDRDITSFIASDHVIGNHSRPSTPKFANLPTLQIPSVPEEPHVPVSMLSTEKLPDFMSGADIPEMSTVAQRIGAYQSRREQMVKADTGLREWLIYVQTIRKADISIVPMTPDLGRIPDRLMLPTAAPVPLTVAGGKVGKKMISKIKVGGRKISAAMEKIGTAAAIQPEKRSSGDILSRKRSDETTPPLAQRSPPRPQRLSPDYSNRIESPQQPLEYSYTEGLPQSSGEYGRTTPVPPVGLGLSSVPTNDNQPATTFSQMHVSEAPPSPVSYHRPETPSSPTVASTKKSHGTKPSFSGGKVSKFFAGITVASESKTKRNSADDSPQRSASPQASPGRSKFSKFVNEISSGPLSGAKPNQQSTQNASPGPPPPPDKSQFQGRLKGFFADISNRDALGNKAGDKPPPSVQEPAGSTSPRAQTPTSPRAQKSPHRPVTNNGTPGGGGGLGRFFSDISKRDISGRTEQEKAAALAAKRETEGTHVPAQPVVYDENASDFEVKIGIMADVLPHISRDVLVDSLKQAGGDERKGIGIAVLGNYGG